jgi:hypothetical protein
VFSARGATCFKANNYQLPSQPFTTKKFFIKILVVITPSVKKRSDCRQRVYDETGNVIETHEQAGDFRFEQPLTILPCEDGAL